MSASISQRTTMLMSGRPNDPWAVWGSLLTSRLSDVALLTPPPDVDIEDDHRGVLDNEIAAVSAIVAHLKERRNTLYRKPKIPVEILEHIFAYAALNEIPGQGQIRKEADAAQMFRARRSGCYDPFHPGKRDPYELLGWIKLTHVCRAWRAIALADANRWLWATMDAGRLSETGVREILERSHPYPVTITITLSTHPDDLASCSVLLEPRYLPRLRSLRIAGDTKRILDKHHIHPCGMMHYGTAILCTLAGRTFDSSGLTLESLVLEQDDADNHVLRLPSKLRLPHLRQLVLVNARPSYLWGLVTYPQLTHLEITASSCLKGQMEIPIGMFITFLRGSPGLQVLRLTRLFPQLAGIESVDEQGMEVRHVHLRHLKELFVQGTLRDCAEFGCYLNLPASCSITADASEDSNPSYEFLHRMLCRWARSSVWRASFSDLGRGDVSRGVKVWYTVADTRANTGRSDGSALPGFTPRLRLAGVPRPPRRSRLTPEQVKFWGTVDGSIPPEHFIYPMRVYVRNERR